MYDAHASYFSTVAARTLRRLDYQAVNLPKNLGLDHEVAFLKEIQRTHGIRVIAEIHLAGNAKR